MMNHWLKLVVRIFFSLFFTALMIYTVTKIFCYLNRSFIFRYMVISPLAFLEVRRVYKSNVHRRTSLQRDKNFFQEKRTFLYFYGFSEVCCAIVTEAQRLLMNLNDFRNFNYGISFSWSLSEKLISEILFLFVHQHKLHEKKYFWQISSAVHDNFYNQYVSFINRQKV